MNVNQATFRATILRSRDGRASLPRGQQGAYRRGRLRHRRPHGSTFALAEVRGDHLRARAHHRDGRLLDRPRRRANGHPAARLQRGVLSVALQVVPHARRAVPRGRLLLLPPPSGRARLLPLHQHPARRQGDPGTLPVAPGLARQVRAAAAQLAPLPPPLAAAARAARERRPQPRLLPEAARLPKRVRDRPAAADALGGVHVLVRRRRGVPRRLRRRLLRRQVRPLRRAVPRHRRHQGSGGAAERRSGARRGRRCRRRRDARGGRRRDGALAAARRWRGAREVPRRWCSRRRRTRARKLLSGAKSAGALALAGALRAVRHERHRVVLREDAR